MIRVGENLSKCLRCLALALLTSGWMVADNVQREALAQGETLADLGRKAEFQQVWKRAVGKRVAPTWIRQLRGVAVPMETVQQGDATYHMGRICKAHDCAKHFLIVAVASDHRQAWGMRVTVQERPEAIQTPSRYAKETWIGRPSEAVKTLLRAELAKDPNWK